MIRFSDDLKKELIQLAAEKEIFLEGNITKIIDTDGHEEFHSYIQSAINRDRENRKKRLEITKTIQEQNKALMEWKSHNEELNKELQLALAESEKAKQLAENDLDVLQKKNTKRISWLDCESCTMDYMRGWGNNFNSFRSYFIHGFRKQNRGIFLEQHVQHSLN